MLNLTLCRLPFSARVLCTLFLLGIGLGQLAAVTQATTAVGLSYQDVVASHTHLFGMTLIAGLLGLLFLFSNSCGESIKALILAMPFVGTVLDIGGMWLTRFVWPPFASLVIAGGSLFGLGYLLIAGVALYEMWIKKEVHE